MTPERGRSVLYAIECAAFYKVGITTHLPRRLAEMELLNPLPVRCAAYRLLWPPRARAVEKEAHQILSAHHHAREWFRAPLDVVAAAMSEAVRRDQVAVGGWKAHDTTPLMSLPISTVIEHSWAQSHVPRYASD